jgi:drug/metabolite transporter (DMT)-like permease
VAWFALARKKRPVFVLSAIMTSLIGTFCWLPTAIPRRSRFRLRPCSSVSPRRLPPRLYEHPSTLIARYGTLPIVGWSMLIAGLMLTPFYAGRGTTFVIDGSLLLAFFYLVVIGTALTFSLYLKGAADDWRAEGEHSELRRAAEQRCCLSSAGVAFTLPDWLGTLLIVSSVVLISMDSRRRVQTSA